jgi:putative membrane protein
MADEKNTSPSDHLANERTFLAWIRTAIGIMGFGFVVVKFSLFVKQLSLALHENVPQPPQRGYSSSIGIAFVVIGALLTVFAYSRYHRTRNRIENRDFRPETGLLTLLTVCIFLMGIALIVYLIGNI